MAGSEVASRQGKRLRLLTLTSAPESGPIQPSWSAFVKRVRRLGDFEYFKAKEFTKSGLAHLHVEFVSKLYLEQAWISHVWKEIHGAPMVYIQAIKNVRAGVAGYVGKYLSKEAGGRYSWSWGWAFKGFVGVWKECKRQFPWNPLGYWNRLLAHIAGGGSLTDVKWLYAGNHI